MIRLRVFAVTGVHHGSIIEAYSNKEARKIFKKHYNGEKILVVKDITTYNLDNL